MKRLKEILGSVRSPIFQVLGIEPEEPVQHLPAWLQAGMVGGKEWLDGTGQAEEVKLKKRGAKTTTTTKY